jgi:putative ABC transport system permease protein
MSDPGSINTYHVFAVDENFFRTYGITTVAGKVFLPSFIPTDAVIVNETAAAQLGFTKPEDAVGEEIYVEIDGRDKARIAGVIENYNHLSLKSDYQPQILFYRASTWSSFTVKVEGENVTEELNTIRQEFGKAFPDNPFDYFFLDEFFDNQYKADQRFERMFAVFSLLAIFISCLGLFGLSSYAIVQRTKEIGIRRVLGATSESIATLLSQGIVKLVFIAGLLALPFSYLIASYWLKNYAFRIEVTGWSLITPVILVLILAMGTIAFQVINTARANLISSLRYE